MRENPDVIECFHVAGEHCFLIKTKAHGPSDLEALLWRIRTRTNVQRSITMIAIPTVKEHGPIVPAEMNED